MTISKLSTNASLKQVMDKFEEISLGDFSSVDITIKNSLPQIVKENQVVVISNTNGKVYIGKRRPSTLLEGDVFIDISNYQAFVNMTIDAKNSCIYVPLHKAIQYVGGKDVEVDCYIGVNGVWTKTTRGYFYIFEPGVGMYEPLSSFTYSDTNCSVSVSKEYITYTVSPPANYTKHATSVGKIDLTEFKKAEIEVQTPFTSTFEIYLGGKGALFDKDVRETRTIDLSNVTGEHNLKFSVYAGYSTVNIRIYSIKLIR